MPPAARCPTWPRSRSPSASASPRSASPGIIRASRPTPDRSPRLSTKRSAAAKCRLADETSLTDRQAVRVTNGVENGRTSATTAPHAAAERGFDDRRRPGHAGRRASPQTGWRVTMTGDRARQDRENSGKSGAASRGAAPERVDDFLDPDDPTLFPRLTEAQIAQLAVTADHWLLAPGEALFEQGQRETPFFVVRAGAVDIFDQRPEGRRYFTQCRAGTFIGDIAVFTGEPTIAAGAAEPTDVLTITPGDLRSLVARSPELGDLILRTMVARRAWLEGHG